MQNTDLLGLKLEDAKRLLEASGEKYSLTITEPFYKGQPRPLVGDSFRVIKQEMKEGSLQLTVCIVPEAAEDEHRLG